VRPLEKTTSTLFVVRKARKAMRSEILMSRTQMMISEWSNLK
jgi:hypothetical protein